MSLRTASFALVTGLAVAATPTLAAAERAPIVEPAVHKTAPVQAAQQDQSSYAQRESQDKKVADYKGGSTVVIAMSGGAFVVLLVLLLLL
jgi:hypothetical protein